MLFVKIIDTQSHWVDPCVVHEKNRHAMTLAVVHEKNTHAMTLGVVHEKEQTCNDSSYGS